MTLVTSDLLPHTIELPVDDDCLRRGVRKLPSGCPIALALRKLYPFATYVSVGIGTVSIGFTAAARDEPFAHYDLGTPGMKFIASYDGGHQPGPVTLYLTRLPTLRNPSGH